MNLQQLRSVREAIRRGFNLTAAGAGARLLGLSDAGSLTKNGGGLRFSFGPVRTHNGDTTLNAGSIAAGIVSNGRLTVTAAGWR